MDVNGTRYHLLYGPNDWGQCSLDGSEETLAELWKMLEDEDKPHLSVPLEWDGSDSASLRLRREIPLVQLMKQHGASLPLGKRRGAGRDRYGNWYWIDESQNGLRFLPDRAYTAVQYWTTAERAPDCTTANTELFAPCEQPPPKRLKLQGLAVTTRHYLVVGVVGEETTSAPDTSGPGLLIFDLYTGGTPLFLRWPPGGFTPWDLAPTADGGLLVLDREHRAYWMLDANFRLMAEVTRKPTDFQPLAPDKEQDCNVTITVQLKCYPVLPEGSKPSLVSIEPGPDGHVLILATDADYSTIYEYDGEQLIKSYALKGKAEVVDPSEGEGVSKDYSIIGHDFAYMKPDKLYVADNGGTQVFAFNLINRATRETMDLKFLRTFLPLHHWGGKALVAVGEEVYYDFADRWVALGEFTECHYAGNAVLITPLENKPEAVAGRPFDSNIPGCVWHRLFLDAQIPQETKILIRARASDDTELLEQSDWSEQPAPYLRSGGAELPYYEPWADMKPVPERTGTWEILFQNINGRYLQLELTIQGNGRSTPAIRALRAWYPRFSYLEQYIPTIYREDPLSASFLERWLANFEGLYTNLEDKIEHASLLFDARTAPANALEWLACWFGMVLDPLWPEDRRRLLIRHIDQLYRMRGTVRGLETAIRLYVDEKVDESLFDAQQKDEGTVRIVEHFLLQHSGEESRASSMQEQQQPLTPEDYTHRFTLLVRNDLDEEKLHMVERIVELEKPVHTAFEMKRFWELFRVGEARSGVNTRLGEGLQFTTLLLGSTHLEHVYLYAPYPFDITNRLVLDRDRLGGLPAL